MQVDRVRSDSDGSLVSADRGNGKPVSPVADAVTSVYNVPVIDRGTLADTHLSRVLPARGTRTACGHDRSPVPPPGHLHVHLCACSESACTRTSAVRQSSPPPSPLAAHQVNYVVARERTIRTIETARTSTGQQRNNIYYSGERAFESGKRLCYCHFFCTSFQIHLRVYTLVSSSFFFPTKKEL